MLAGAAFSAAWLELSPVFGLMFVALYVAIVVFIIWQIISALNRISRGVEDIAHTLRRMESAGNRPQPGA